MKRIPLPWTTVFGYTTGMNKMFIPATPWIPAHQVKRLRATFEMIGAQQYLSATFAYQTANVENSPDTPVHEVGSAQTVDGMNYGTITDVSSDTGQKQLVRFGWNCQNTNAATLIVGLAGGSVDFDDT